MDKQITDTATETAVEILALFLVFLFWEQLFPIWEYLSK